MRQECCQRLDYVISTRTPDQEEIIRVDAAHHSRLTMGFLRLSTAVGINPLLNPPPANGWQGSANDDCTTE
jgi:hypothetical protein